MLALATRFRQAGVEVTLDQWHLVPGDQLPLFMEAAVRGSDYVLVICTPRYKDRSDRRTGGVGYEGDIMTAEVMANQDQRKFIPILRGGTWNEAAPSWVLGKYYIDLRGEPYSEDQFNELISTLHGTRPQAPPVGKSPASVRPARTAAGPQLEFASHQIVGQENGRFRHRFEVRMNMAHGGRLTLVFPRGADFRVLPENRLIQGWEFEFGKTGEIPHVVIPQPHGHYTIDVWTDSASVPEIRTGFE